MEEEPIYDADGYLYVSLCDWILMPHGNGEVVGYGIRTISTHTRFKKMSFLTRRRYPDYVDFWRFIQSRNTHVQLPPLPFPDDFVPEVDSPATIDRKFVLFRAYFANFVRIPAVFNDPAFPIFCQTHMKMPEIRREIERQERAAAAGISHGGGDAAAAAADDNGNVEVAGAVDNGGAAADNVNNNEGQENDGNQSDEEPAARGNRRHLEDDEPIFQMDDI